MIEKLEKEKNLDNGIEDNNKNDFDSIIKQLKN